MLGLNGGLRRESDLFATTDQVSVADAGLKPGPGCPAHPGRGDKRHRGCACCSKGTVIWRGRQDKHMKQLVNKITARLVVLYPDIIKYMLYNTIRDKSEAHRTNYTGQRVSKREL